MTVISEQARHAAAGRTVALAAALLLAAIAFIAPQSALAQQFPELTGRVIDAANIIPADAEARLTRKLEALETQSQRQLVVATLPGLQGYDISDYGYQLGRHWGLGDKERNDGALLIVAPNERKLRIEVGYGLEPVLTDGLSSLIINQTIVPRFKQGDMVGGIEAGTDAIIQQLTLPEEEALKVAAQARQAPQNGNPVPVIIFMLFILFFFVLPILRALFGHGGGRRMHGSRSGPIVWMPGGFSGGHSSGGFSGGFSGGGGSFGGGGASGSW